MTVRVVLRLLSAVSLLACVWTVRAQNLVQDPGFELSPGSNGATDGFSPFWNPDPPVPGGNPLAGLFVATSPQFAHSGNNYAFVEGGTLSQVLSTTAGTAYFLTFWLANPPNTRTGSLQVYINGILLTTSYGSTISSTTYPADGVYRQVQSFFVADSSSTMLQFGIFGGTDLRHGPHWFYLDDIGAFVVPEGGTSLAVLFAIWGGLVLHHRKLRRDCAIA